MKSIVTAALVLVVEAGFILSLAVSPGPAEIAASRARSEVSARRVPAAPGRSGIESVTTTSSTGSW